MAIEKYYVDLAYIGYYKSDYEREKVMKCKINKDDLHRINSILEHNEGHPKTFRAEIKSYDNKTFSVRVYIEVDEANTEAKKEGIKE